MSSEPRPGWKVHNYIKWHLMHQNEPPACKSLNEIKPDILFKISMNLTSSVTVPVVTSLHRMYFFAQNVLESFNTFR